MATGAGDRRGRVCDVTVKHVRVVACLVVCATLAACASHKPRPARSIPATGASPPQPATRFRDDTARVQSDRYRQKDDNGPGAPIDVSKIPEPVPKVEPRSRYGNKETYSVLGRTYHVLSDTRGYDERGIASWYGNKFHGYMTSSFEAYDMYAFTAAHKTLPLPSFARVTNLENGKSVVVRINDRGPFHENRIIDLSYAAAVKIGVWPKGTGLVEVRAIDPAHPQAPPARGPLPALPVLAHAGNVAATTAPNNAAPRIYLQLGAYGERANAERAQASAQHAGLDHVGIESVAIGGRTVHRVRVGPLSDARAADALSARIERLGLGAPRVSIER